MKPYSRLMFAVVGLLLGGLGGVMLAGTDASAKASPADETRMRLMSLRGAIAVFKIRTDRWPRTLEDLVEARLVDQVPRDGWDNSFVWVRPVNDDSHGCLLSSGADGRTGSVDDLVEGCDLRLLNQHLLVDAGFHHAMDRLDAYGNQIRIIKGNGVSLAWSYGRDGRPDTSDDQVARVARREREAHEAKGEEP